MSILKRYWPDFGILLALGVTIYVYEAAATLSPLRLLLWISLISLFFHQFEEYRVPGGFPQMVNRTLFRSTDANRFPLNRRVAFVINVCIGWVAYLLAAILGPTLIWVAIASIMISVGNFFVHVFLFNVRGRTLYNPGMITALFLFAPISILFFWLLITNHLATPFDYAFGIVLGLLLNYVGIIKMIDWMKDANSTDSF